MIRVTVWNEFRHEKASKEVAAIYPNGLRKEILELYQENGIEMIRGEQKQ